MAGKVVGIMAAGAQKCGEVLRPISGPGEMVVRYSEDSRTHTSTMQFLYQPGSTVDGLERHDDKLIAGGGGCRGEDCHRNWDGQGGEVSIGRGSGISLAARVR